jgi:4-aminobutyrate aminotransferase
VEKKENLIERGNKVLSPALTHSTFVEVVKGRGVYLYDKDGREYLDFATGIAVCAVGHCHPKVVAAAERQMENLIHACSGIVYYEQNIALAEKLKKITPEGLDMTFFGQSGTEAIEAAIKLAKYVSKKQGLIAFNGSFHGRTLGSLSITFSKAKYREGYEPLLPNVYLAPYPYCYRCDRKMKTFKKKPKGEDFPLLEGCSMECLRDTETIIKKVKQQGIAAIVIEPIQGEGGYIVPPKEFIVGLRELCDRYGIFLVFDEVQTGFGRTGKMFASEHFGVSPDIMALAKAIASGLPLSATIAKEEIMKAWSPGAHGSTMTGNPVTCAASLATIEVLETENLIENSRTMGRYMKDAIEDMAEEHKIIGDVRGVGLMIGVEFVKAGTKGPDAEVVKKVREGCLKGGLILIGCGSHDQVIRIVPPLTVNKEQVDKALKIFEEALKSAEKA